MPPGDGVIAGWRGRSGRFDQRVKCELAAPGSASQHAAAWPSPTSKSGGSSTQRSKASGQRGWKRQPRRDVRRVGRLADEDRPLRALARRGGSGDGETETSAAVYGWRGERMTVSAGPISMIRPRYMTAIRSAMTQASDRSWVMNR